MLGLFDVLEHVLSPIACRFPTLIDAKRMGTKTNRPIARLTPVLPGEFCRRDAPHYGTRLPSW